MERARIFQTTAALLVLLTAAPPVAAQPSASWLCRVHYEDYAWGGDIMTTRGVVDLIYAAPQVDGGVYYMGSGAAQIVHTATGPCTTVGGASATARIRGIVSSEDGRTAEVDLIPVDYEFPARVQCGPDWFESDVGVNVPPTVTLPLQDGAYMTYGSDSRSGFATGGERGTVRLEFCHPN